MHLHLWHILVIAMAGWMNQEQSAVIEYLREENRILRELLGKKRPRLNEDQRRRLAAKGKALGRKLLSRCYLIVAPDRVLRWHQRLLFEPATSLSEPVEGWPPVMNPLFSRPS